MISRRARSLATFARYVQKPALRFITPPGLARRVFTLNAIIAHTTPAGLRTARLDKVPHCTACTLDSDAPHGTLLYCHGGAFMLGNLRGYRQLVARLGHDAGMQGVFADYRLAPEHPFPAALDDLTDAYLALCDDPSAGPIALAGDSAGGNLALALLHRIIARGLPKPCALVALSPITDLRLTNPSLTANRRRDPLVPVEWGARGVRAYLADQDPANPEISPILGTFAGAPPIQLQVDTTEVLYDDSRLMAAHLRAQGVDVTLTETTGLPHVHHLHVGHLPEADAATAAAGAFIAASRDRWTKRHAL